MARNVIKALFQRVRGSRKGSKYVRYFKTKTEMQQARKRAQKLMSPNASQRIDRATASEARKAIRKRVTAKLEKNAATKIDSVMNKAGSQSVGISRLEKQINKVRSVRTARAWSKAIKKESNFMSGQENTDRMFDLSEDFASLARRLAKKSRRVLRRKR